MDKPKSEFIIIYFLQLSFNEFGTELKFKVSWIIEKAISVSLKIKKFQSEVEKSAFNVGWFKKLSKPIVRKKLNKNQHKKKWI